MLLMEVEELAERLFAEAYMLLLIILNHYYYCLFFHVSSPLVRLLTGDVGGQLVFSVAN